MTQFARIAEGKVAPEEAARMARWPRHRWTTVFTYGTIFVLFPLICLLAYLFVRYGLPW